MTTSFPSVQLDNSWVDLVVSTPGIASVDGFFQNTGKNDLRIFFGGTSAPADGDGNILKPGDSFQGNSAHVWARGSGATSKIAFAAV